MKHNIDSPFLKLLSYSYTKIKNGCKRTYAWGSIALVVFLRWHLIMEVMLTLVTRYVLGEVKQPPIRAIRCGRKVIRQRRETSGSACTFIRQANVMLIISITSSTRLCRTSITARFSFCTVTVDTRHVVTCESKIVCIFPTVGLQYCQIGVNFWPQILLLFNRIIRESFTEDNGSTALIPISFLFNFLPFKVKWTQFKEIALLRKSSSNLCGILALSMKELKKTFMKLNFLI